MDDAEKAVHLERMYPGQAATFRWRRDYGKKAQVNVNLAVEQLQRMEALKPWASTSEHVRRAIDLYLAEQER